MSDVLPLTDLQVRIIGCLIEKRATTPDQYPLTLNALRNACNQKTNRFPITNYELGDIGHSLRQLSNKQIIRMERSSRAERYEHRLQHILDLKPRDIAVLSTIMLRGPQTAAEIKARTYTVLGLDDLDAVHQVLNRLMEREPALVMKIPRQPGQREERFVHLLAGEPDLSQLAIASVASRSSPSQLEARVDQLEHAVHELQTLVQNLLNKS